jgi:hypothetical protein
MKKFLVLFRAPTASFEALRNASKEQRKVMFDAWMAWTNKASASIVDSGAPLGKSLRITASDASPVANDLGSFSIFQAESQEALALTLKDHPHLLRAPERFIEIVELMPMPSA